jgi:hypothetical protein
MVSRSSERGSSLIVAILACALVAAAIGILSQDLTDRQRLFRHEARVIGLTHLGDAALATTLAELDADPAYPGLATRRIHDGTIESRVAAGMQGSLNIVVRVELEGWIGRLEAVVDLGDTGPVVRRWRRWTEPG